MKRDCTKTAKHQEDGTSCFHLAKTGCCIQELYWIDLWPIPNTKSQRSVQGISDRLLSFEDRSVSESDHCDDEEYCDLDLSLNFKKMLLRATEKISERGGLCMNCVKKGKIMVADGNCRAKSLESCKGIFE